MTGTVTIEPYAPHDRPGCSAIFDSNTPRFFDPAEQPAFAAFLDALPGPFWVVRNESGALADCGGVSITDDGRSAWLRWGMVSADQHRRGIGRRLLKIRLCWLDTQPTVQVIRVATSGEVSGFFERMGFDLICTTENSYGAGRDRHDFELRRGSQYIASSLGTGNR